MRITRVFLGRQSFTFSEYLSITNPNVNDNKNNIVKNIQKIQSIISRDNYLELVISRKFDKNINSNYNFS